MSKYILDCGAPSTNSSETNCTLTGYSPPAATVDHYVLAPTWVYGMVGVLVLAAILALAIHAYHRIDSRTPSRADRRLEVRKAELDAKARIAEAHDSCQNCGVVYSPKLEDIKT